MVPMCVCMCVCETDDALNRNKNICLYVSHKPYENLCLWFSHFKLKLYYSEMVMR